MGLCHSEEEKVGNVRSKEIDKELKSAQTANQRTVKLLLLGTGECGKSTVLKQMRILHSQGFSVDELRQQRSVVYNNTILAMADILKAMPRCGVMFANPDREKDARTIQEIIKTGRESSPFTPEVAEALMSLWADANIAKMYEEKRLVCHLHESSKFFLDNVARIAETDYSPTEQDVLLTRIKTTGIVEVVFVIKKVNFRVFDVGGQRSERKKWIHCFEDVNGIIFITAISEFDEKLAEDEETNRILESARLFDSICNSRWFINTSVILFLNKKDLFAEKIKMKSITEAFPEYSGPQTYEDSVAYIKKKFESLNSNKQKTIFTHETCATDTDQVQKILDSVISTIIQQNLHKTGLY